MVAARWLVRVRSSARPWLRGFGSLLPQRAERELFSWLVRDLERRPLAGYGARAPNRACRERAAVLLARSLSSTQRRCLRKRGFFVVAARSGRRYRIWARRQLAVELVDRDAASRYPHKPWLYCIHNDFEETEGLLPLADYLLELKLCLEAAEEHFLITANPHFERGEIDRKELLDKLVASEPDRELPRGPVYSEVTSNRPANVSPARHTSD